MAKHNHIHLCYEVENAESFPLKVVAYDRLSSDSYLFNEILTFWKIFE